MQKSDIKERIGKKYLTHTTPETEEFSYIDAAGSKIKLIEKLGYTPKHCFPDIRCKDDKSGVVVLVETKGDFTKKNEEQLREYVNEEIAVFGTKKIIAILANTQNDNFKIWKNKVSDENLLENQTAIDTMEYYISLFKVHKQNDREKVLKNTYDLNELLHKKDIPESLRSQFVGTALLYIKDLVKIGGFKTINNETVKKLSENWENNNTESIIGGIKGTLKNLLNESNNKDMKIKLLENNVLENQKVKSLTHEEWKDLLVKILEDIYCYIDEDSDEGQDILNLFFIAFNKYTGKADKNQAFTPDHITDFMVKVTEVDRNKKVFDGTCGSGSFLVQAMVKELADCKLAPITEQEKNALKENIKKNNIYGIEIEEVAFGLSTTNMLIHGDGNSNIKLGSLFDNKDFFLKTNPDIILMNPPYNAKPKTIPDKYKSNWSKEQKNGKEDPTKGFVFIRFISDCVKEINAKRNKNGEPQKEVKLAVLLPVSVAIGANKAIKEVKKEMLTSNTLEAVFTLPNDVFYPGASASVCCMLFTLGKQHILPDGKSKETFFGYYKEDGHKKKKNLGRIEQFDSDDFSLWKKIEDIWLDLYRNKKVKVGLSATAIVTAEDEWLAEAYMETDYSSLADSDFEKTIRDYYSYLIKTGGTFNE